MRMSRLIWINQLQLACNIYYMFLSLCLLTGFAGSSEVGAISAALRDRSRCCWKYPGATARGKKINHLTSPSRGLLDRKRRSKETSPLHAYPPRACCLRKVPENLFGAGVHTQHPARSRGPAKRLPPAKHMGGERDSPGCTRASRIQPDMIAGLRGRAREQSHKWVRKIH